jgi:hypothetical protein
MFDKNNYAILSQELQTIIFGYNTGLTQEQVKNLVENNFEILMSAFVPELKKMNSEMSSSFSETIGDIYLKLVMTNWLVKEKKIYSAETLTNIQANLCSKYYLPVLAKKFHIDKLIDMSAVFGCPTFILEDALESHIGTLAMAVENTFGINHVYMIMYKMVINMYSHLNISENSIYAKKNPRQYLKEIFELFKLGSVKFKKNEEMDGSITITVFHYPNSKNRGFFKKLCSYNCETELEANFHVTDIVLNMFNVTESLILEKKYLKNSNPKIKELEQKLNLLINTVGYGNLEKKISQSSKHIYIWIIVENLMSHEKSSIFKYTNENSDIFDTNKLNPTTIYQKGLEHLLSILEQKNMSEISQFINERANTYKSEFLNLKQQETIVNNYFLPSLSSSSFCSSFYNNKNNVNSNNVIVNSTHNSLMTKNLWHPNITIKPTNLTSYIPTVS